MKGTVWPDAAMVGDDGKPQNSMNSKPSARREPGREEEKGGRFWTYCTGKSHTDVEQGPEVANHGAWREPKPSDRSNR